MHAKKNNSLATCIQQILNLRYIGLFEPNAGFSIPCVVSQGLVSSVELLWLLGHGSSIHVSTSPVRSMSNSRKPFQLFEHSCNSVPKSCYMALNVASSRLSRALNCARLSLQHHALCACPKTISTSTCPI